jgi:hypothetical protein
MKQIFAVIIGLVVLVIDAVSQTIPVRGRTPPRDLQNGLDQFNAEVAAWNARCRITRSAAEDTWCQKERAQIDARKAELIALGAVRK